MACTTGSHVWHCPLARLAEYEYICHLCLQPLANTKAATLEVPTSLDSRLLPGFVPGGGFHKSWNPCPPGKQQQAVVRPFLVTMTMRPQRYRSVATYV